mgnify:CR=1 FL=1
MKKFNIKSLIFLLENGANTLTRDIMNVSYFINLVRKVNKKYNNNKKNNYNEKDKKYLKIIELFLKHGKNIDLYDKDSNDESIYEIVYNNNNIDIFNLFIKYEHIQLNKQNIFGNNFLIDLALNQNTDFMKKILDKKPNPNIQNNKGNTAGIILSYLNNFQGVKLLVEYGCNINLKNKKGYDMLFFAYENNNKDMIKLLGGKSRKTTKNNINDKSLESSICPFTQETLSEMSNIRRKYIVKLGSNIFDLDFMYRWVVTCKNSNKKPTNVLTTKPLTQKELNYIYSLKKKREKDYGV